MKYLSFSFEVSPHTLSPHIFISSFLFVTFRWGPRSVLLVLLVVVVVVAVVLGVVVLLGAMIVPIGCLVIGWSAWFASAEVSCTMVVELLALVVPIGRLGLVGRTACFPPTVVVWAAVVPTVVLSSSRFWCRTTKWMVIVASICRCWSFWLLQFEFLCFYIDIFKSLDDFLHFGIWYYGWYRWKSHSS